MSQKPEESSFKVSDRRRFSPEGDPLEPEASEPDRPSAERAPEPAPEPAAQAAEARAPESHKAEQAASHLPPASFELLVMSLGMQAQMELGAADEGRTPNLDLARHTIDLLGVLQEKTKGNLSLDESRLLENTLTELRFRYIQCVEEINQKAKTSS